MIVFRLPLLIVLYLLGAVAESLPSTEKQAGPFVSGMVWAFGLHWFFLTAVTLLWQVTR